MVVYAASGLSARSEAYSLLERGAAEAFGLSPLPRVDRAPGGKPFFPEHPHLHFNLSHSGNFALCALDGAPVGADVQTLLERWRPGLPGRVCSLEELAWLEEQEDRHCAFTLLWALKEARVKWAGTGLRGDIRSAAVPLPEPGVSLYQLDGLWFRTYAGAGWRGAVCGHTPPPGELIWK